MLQDAMETAGNIALLGMQGSQLSPYQLIRQTVKHTTKSFITHLETNNNSNNAILPSQHQDDSQQDNGNHN